MVNQYLKYLGFNEQTIQMLPKDIIDAATIYDMIQQVYVDIPASDSVKKASFAKGIAEGTRNLLLRINALVTTSPQIQQSVQQQIQQLPPQVRPQVVPPPPPPTHTPIVSQPPVPTPPVPTPPRPTAPRPTPPPPAPPIPPKKKRKPKKGEPTEKEKQLINKLKNVQF